MGGGGFTMEPSNPLLDDYVLSLARAQQPRILFLPTASGDTSAQITAFQERFCDRLCIPEHLSLFRLRDVRRPLEEIVLGQDIIYVGGGSMRNLLALWKAHELEALLVKAWSTGTVLVGLSVLRGSLTVHADGEPERLPVWLASLREGATPGGWAVDDGVGLLFRGARLERVVSSRPGAGALRVDAIAGELVRQRLQPELLGEGEPRVLGGTDEAVAELRRVHRMRRGLGDG